MTCIAKNKKIFIFRKSETFMQRIYKQRIQLCPNGVDVLQKKTIFKVQKINHKALKVVYNSNKNYNELPRDNNEASIHQSRTCFNM